MPKPAAKNGSTHGLGKGMTQKEAKQLGSYAAFVKARDERRKANREKRAQA